MRLMPGAAKAMNYEQRRFLKRRALTLTVAMLCWLAIPAIGSAQVAPPPDENPYNTELMHLRPEEQAAKLADHLGIWCIGTKPFFMGVTKTGQAKGYAYWSLTCAGSMSYMIQITPDGQGTALDCRVLKAQGQGRECYKTF
jgi:hypothetical protein